MISTKLRAGALAAVCGVLLSLLPMAATAAQGQTGPSEPGDGSWTIAPYEGAGIWVDTYDYTDPSSPSTSYRPGDAAALAAQGVRTLFIQSGRSSYPVEGFENRELLEAIIADAHANGIYVVGWYLPAAEDVDYDVKRIIEHLSLPWDGYAIDIESTAVRDLATRNANHIELSRQLRAAVGDRHLGAITVPPVITELLRSGYWNDFPIAELGALYDVMLPMGYWTFRSSAPGPDGVSWRSGYRYTVANVDLIHAVLGDDYPVHPVGGLMSADPGLTGELALGATTDDIVGMTAALFDATGWTPGCSLYDLTGTGADDFAALARCNELISVAQIDPVGALDLVVTTEVGTTIAGWARDDSDTRPVTVEISVDGIPVVYTIAGQGASKDRYAALVHLTPESEIVCVKAYDIGGGLDNYVGCRVL